MLDLTTRQGLLQAIANNEFVLLHGDPHGIVQQRIDRLHAKLDALDAKDAR